MSNAFDERPRCLAALDIGAMPFKNPKRRQPPRPTGNNNTRIPSRLWMNRTNLARRRTVLPRACGYVGMGWPAIADVEEVFRVFDRVRFAEIIGWPCEASENALSNSGAAG